jgi:hypothetical protein
VGRFNGAYEKQRDLPAFLESSKHTQKLIETGQISYVDLGNGGGCMRPTGPCSSYGMDWTFPCDGCADSLHTQETLRAQAESIEFSMTGMSPKSPAYKYSKQRLDSIYHRLKK